MGTIREIVGSRKLYLTPSTSITILRHKRLPGIMLENFLVKKPYSQPSSDGSGDSRGQGNLTENEKPMAWSEMNQLEPKEEGRLLGGWRRGRRTEKPGNQNMKWDRSSIPEKIRLGRSWRLWQESIKPRKRG